MFFNITISSVVRRVKTYRLRDVSTCCDWLFIKQRSTNVTSEYNDMKTLYAKHEECMSTTTSYLNHETIVLVGPTALSPLKKLSVCAVWQSLQKFKK